jgi:pyruvate formate lyase activating enzyme
MLSPPKAFRSYPPQLIRPALLQEPADQRIRCLTCERRCEIAPGDQGWCRTRLHRGGELVTLIYGAVSSLSANPIEKKPLYHFYPGTLALTSGAFSCNFGCPWCQNHLEVFRRARVQGLYNTYVTNGYMTPEALESLVEAGLDAMNVDVKGDAQAVRRYCKGIDVEKVWRNCRLARQLGLHLEITTLVIPGVNDRDDVLRSIAERIVADLGPDVPWHISGYYPAYRFTAPPTPVRTLERAWGIGREAGLGFVYIGNVPGHRQENTYCPDCETLLIRRWGLWVTEVHLDHRCCPDCGRKVPGVWAVSPGAEQD